ncbi:MAG TPA: PhzF family phenazine biosynthesis protein [Acidimicrobiales bacterium]|nr:PhzF family phenazine biosynthesis protein [Acidimicrobiales bacterium]
MSRGIPIFQVDAFTSEPFGGNPAGVCLLAEPADPAWMQAVAGEMNVSETAFLVRANPEGALGLRWFSPTTEVELCGHATLATAHVLWSEEGVAPDQPLRFGTLSGTLTARRSEDRITLDLPANPPAGATLTPDVLAALGVDAVRCGAAEGWDVIEVATEEEVAAAAPDLSVLRRSDRGFILTARAGAEVVCRVFVPAFGIDEDPVTGSAQCVLGPWWAPRLGTDEFTVRQLSRRGGTLHLGVGAERVSVGGHAVTTLRAALLH